MSWYYVENSKQAGPVDDTTFEGLVSSGTITSQTLVWKEGMSEWLPYGQTLTHPQVTLSTELETIGAHPRQSPSHLHQAALAPHSERSHLGNLRYAGFWIRVVAKLVDGIILGCITFPITLIVNLTIFQGLATEAAKHQPTAADPLVALKIMAPLVAFVIVTNLLIQASYSIFFLTKYGATLGKMICSLKVITPDGGPISFGRALGRYFGEFLSAIIFYIGYIMVGFDPEKRSLHDRLCGTRVIKK